MDSSTQTNSVIVPIPTDSVIVPISRASVTSTTSPCHPHVGDIKYQCCTSRKLCTAPCSFQH